MPPKIVKAEDVKSNDQFEEWWDEDESIKFEVEEEVNHKMKYESAKKVR